MWATGRPSVGLHPEGSRHSPSLGFSNTSRLATRRGGAVRRPVIRVGESLVQCAGSDRTGGHALPSRAAYSIRGAICGGFLVVAAACSSAASGSTSPRTPPSPASSASAITSASCTAPARLTAGAEYRGDAEPRGAAVYAYVENDPFIGPSGLRSVKIRWTVSGHGEPDIFASSSSAASIRPDQGVIPHGPSSIGGADEFGTNWLFPIGGCWTFSVRRTDMSAVLALDLP